MDTIHKIDTILEPYKPLIGTATGAALHNVNIALSNIAMILSILYAIIKIVQPYIKKKDE